VEWFDVAVVGAGPAGASAAHELERLGADYVLVDRCSFPRSKPCAGVLTPKIEETLGTLPPGAFERRVRGYFLHTLSGRTFISRFPHPGYTVNRASFDSFLLSRLRTRPVVARFLGLEQNRGWVRVRTSGGELACRYLIGADGSGSRVRASLGIRPGPMVLACQTTIPMPPSKVLRRTGGWFHVFYTVPGGYGWVAPHRACLRVGVGSALPGAGGRRSLSEFLRRTDVRRLTGGKGGRGLEAHRIPAGGPLRTLSKGRALLAGDAGGFVFPGTGEGIRFAILSGAVAARAAALCLRTGASGREVGRIYLRMLDEEGLLSLREVDFQSSLRDPGSAEKYVLGLLRLSGGAC